MSVLPTGIAAPTGGYEISRSVRTRASASAYFNRTPASATNRRTWTWSGWVKRGSLSTANNQYLFSAVPTASVRDAILFNTSSGLSVFANDASSAWLVTTQVFRDPSAWYHIVVAVDTTQATSSNRIKVYLNGTQITSFSTATYPTQNYDWGVNNTVRHTIGDDAANAPTGLYHFDGYQTEVNFIDGQALTPSSFGETDTTTGVWKPKKYGGTYGTNGFYLNFSDNSAATAAAIGKDSSGNGNNWTPNNISVTSGVTYDSMTDVPTLNSATAANFCVLSPLDKDSGNTVSDGNLKVTTSSSGQGFQRGTMFVNSGKWYWEVTVTSATGNSSIGIAGPNTQADTLNYIGYTSDSYGYVATNGNKYNNGSSAAYGATYTTGNVIGVALDMDAGTLTFYKNNASQGTAYSSLSGYFAPAVSDVSNTLSSVFDANFGQRPFAYTPPTGFKALNTYNLPDSTIKNGAAYMAAVPYSGDSSYPRTIDNSNNPAGVTFQPDLVWVKSRSIDYDHILYDSARGTGTGASLVSNATGAEGVDAAYANLTAFASNGFTVGSTSGTNVLNVSGKTFVAWQWKESVSAGFDIVTYTGDSTTNRQIAHGLGVAPSMMIIKNRDFAWDWIAYHKSIGATGYLYLNQTAATTTSINPFNNTAPTSSVFTVAGNSGNTYVNYTGAKYVAYLFAEVAGYSKFGSYTGNGSADGPFVYLGFRPRYVLWKRTDSTSDWNIIDTARDTYNYGEKELFPNLSNAETVIGGGLSRLDMLANGFKVRGADSYQNANGGTYIYAAFAESPFRYSLAR